jgi:hypothetical protein
MLGPVDLPLAVTLQSHINPIAKLAWLVDLHRQLVTPILELKSFKIVHDLSIIPSFLVVPKSQK